LNARSGFVLVRDDLAFAMKPVKKRLRWLVFGGLPIFAALVLWYGIGWRVELDVRSGRERHVTLVLGFPVYKEAPRDSELSEWLGSPMGEPEWIRVTGQNVSDRGVSVSWC
jgi:hypothetical protein